MAVPLLQNVFPLERMPLLSEIPLDKTLDEETYRKELKHLKQRLGELHNRLYRKKVPVIIAYEGWDAAGKGGNIKRITSALDPRAVSYTHLATEQSNKGIRVVSTGLLHGSAARDGNRICRGERSGKNDDISDSAGAGAAGDG